MSLDQLGQLTWGRFPNTLPSYTFGSNETYNTGSYSLTLSSSQEAMPVAARIIRYMVVPKDIKVVKALGTSAIVMEGRSVLVGADNIPLYVEIAEAVKENLQLLNERLAAKTWKDDRGVARAFDPLTVSDLDIVIETIKTY